MNSKVMQIQGIGNRLLTWSNTMENVRTKGPAQVTETAMESVASQ